MENFPTMALDQPASFVERSFLEGKILTFSRPIYPIQHSFLLRIRILFEGSLFSISCTLDEGNDRKREIRRTKLPRYCYFPFLYDSIERQSFETGGGGMD